MLNQGKTICWIEIAGKRLGVIGLGAIGALVANDALALGMDVVGYDPYISVETAWRLSTHVQRAFSLDEILQRVIILPFIFLLRIKRRE